MFDTPGTLAATQTSAGIVPLSEQQRFGIDWHAVQVWNDGPRSRAVFSDIPAGMKKVGWGVTYFESRFAFDGAGLAQACILDGLDGLIIDAEECLKGADPRPLIEALSSFKGPKALTTIGSTTDWRQWTLEDTANVQVQPWIDADYWLMPQAYANEETFFDPVDCVQHWEKCGWPTDRMNVMIGTHISASDKGLPNNRWNGYQYRVSLDFAQLQVKFPRRALSIFLSESTNPVDYISLAPYLARPVQAPLTPLQEAAEALRPVVEAWRSKGLSDQSILRQRAGFALRVLETELPEWYGTKFATVDELIAELVD